MAQLHLPESGQSGTSGSSGGGGEFKTPPISPRKVLLKSALTSGLKLEVPPPQPVSGVAPERHVSGQLSQDAENDDDSTTDSTTDEDLESARLDARRRYLSSRTAPPARLEGAAERALDNVEGRDPLTLGVLSAPVVPVHVPEIEFPGGMSPRPVKTKVEASPLQSPDPSPPPSPKRLSKDGGVLRKTGPLAPHSALGEEELEAMLVK